MIVKKIPIFQGFPALDTVKYLSNIKNELSDYNPIFYDIETTGLSRYTAFVYLIGAVRFEENAWYLYQWMCAEENEEAQILQEFYEFLILKFQYLVESLHFCKEAFRYSLLFF